MQRCQNCGTELPENAQFCGQCGFTRSVTTNTQTISSNFTNYENMTQQSTGGVQKEEEEERRRRMLLGLPLLGDAQPSAGNAPMVQGSPSMGGVPMIQGTPSSGSMPMAQGSPSIGGAPAHELYNAGMSYQPQQLFPAPGQTPPLNPYGEFNNIAPPPTYHPFTPPPPTYHPVEPHRPVHKKGLRSIPIWVVIPVVIIIIIGGILGTILIFLPPSLSISGDTISGGTLNLHGIHFFPAGTVTLTLDNGQGLTLVSPVGPITVSGTGTFDATIGGTENWSVGQHTIHAQESSGGRNGELSFTLNANHTKVTPNVASFSSPGDAHCAYHGNQGWLCQSTISTSASALGKLVWSVASSGLNGITITPTSGSLAPGQTQQVTMAIPNTVCPATATFTFTFKGGEDPVSMKWSCATPQYYWNAVNCPQSNGDDVCPIVVQVTAKSEGLLSWTAYGNSSGVLINPQSGTIAPGQSQPISVAFPTNPCTNTSWSIKDTSGKVYTANLTCH